MKLMRSFMNIKNIEKYEGSVDIASAYMQQFFYTGK